MSDPIEPKPRFSTWLQEHRNGVLDVELADVLEELVRAVGRTEKGGTLTLKLKVTSEGEMVAVNDTITAAIPEKREARLYWVDLDGRLTRTNPLQPALVNPNGETPPDLKP